MSQRRVVVTGMSGLCALGEDWESVGEKLRSGSSGVSRISEYEGIDGLKTRLGARVHGFTTPGHYPRKRIRGMGRVSLLATRATEQALLGAGLLGSPEISDGTAGLAFGSTSGSPPEMVEYARAFGVDHSIKGVVPAQYIRLMSHTTVANLAQFFGVRGRVHSTCSACASGSQAIGFGYEAIRWGRQDLMICGGAEELHVIESAVFDLMFATSTRNDEPETTPRPFDVDRDGLVIGEGAGALILEELEHAQARGAEVLAELVGYGTNCDGFDVMKPDSNGMQGAMELALRDADLSPADVGYVNAHATATPVGDVAESRAIERVFGNQIPVSSLKGHMGHTLGACGALEAWMTLGMLRESWLAPTLNLEHVDPECGSLDYLQGAPREVETEFVVSNNFAFGGVNTSLVFRRWAGS